MLKYNSKIWWQFLFKPSGYFFEGMLWSMFFYGILTTGLNFLYLKYPIEAFDISPTFHTVLGLVIGLLLVFRTNTAYDRWWEGRKQLGMLVNTTRHFTMKVEGYLGDFAFVELIKIYPYVLKEHLREQEYIELDRKSPKWIKDGITEAQHKPNYLLDQMSKKVILALKSGSISGEQLLVLENEIEKLSNIQGACERIKNTPIPFGYAIHLKRILLIYLITLPFGFVKTLHWWSIPLMMLVFFTMIGIELIGEEIEDPFGKDVNDLPIDELQDKIEGNIDEIHEKFNK
jgi:putative membrane protein